MRLRQLVLLSVVCLGIAESNDNYNEALANKFWLFTCAGYCSTSKIESWSCGDVCSKAGKLEDVKVFINSTNENAGFSAYDPSNNHIIFHFRGTVPWLIQNWVQDLKFFKSPYKYCDNDCQVHRGFLEAFNNIKDQFFSHYHELRSRYPNAKIAVIGHSLGGAMATHAIVQLVLSGNPVDHFYTFGSPRVGDKNFFTWFNTKIFPQQKYRITHSHDPVPHLPMFSQGFHHINNEIYYKGANKQGFKQCDDSSKEDDTCSNSNWTDLNIIDHNSYMDYNQMIFVLTCQ